MGIDYWVVYTNKSKRTTGIVSNIYFKASQLVDDDAYALRMHFKSKYYFIQSNSWKYMCGQRRRQILSTENIFVGIHAFTSYKTQVLTYATAFSYIIPDTHICTVA